MFKTVFTRLGLSEGKKASLRETASSVKDISEYLSDALALAKDSDYLKAMAAAAPWAGMGVSALGEAIPPVKFAAKLFSDLTKETDPEALGHLACTLAYQRAIEDTVNSMRVPIVSTGETKDIKKRLAALEPSADVDFKTFSFANALTHDFVLKADEVLKAFALIAGYNDEQTRFLIGGVHRWFRSDLKILLSDGHLKDRFGPFTTLIGLGSSEHQANQALSDHADYQRWLFEEDAVFKIEPYSLSDIYVNTRCGSLTQGDIKTGKNPFSDGDTQAMVDTVLELIGDPGFEDAIVIQGAAGAGKSSLTLKLCSELSKTGLRPIRVRLSDVRSDLHISDALPDAVHFGDENFSTSSSQSAPDDLFLGGSIFKERVPFRNAEICPYVLILDGWNEISIAADEGFKIRVSTFLDQIRAEYLNKRKGLVRLILTGRPSKDVNESRFFLNRTRVLTIRPLEPTDLENFIKALSSALKVRRIHVDDNNRWTIPRLNVFKPILDAYRKEFEGKNQPATSESNADIYDGVADEITPSRTGSMAVLGFPLLAHLAIRQISQSPADRDELLTNPTALYRSLFDLTIPQSGKAPEAVADAEGQDRLAGAELRTFLWRTAALMTMLGEERISYSELEQRLNLDDIPRKKTITRDELPSLMTNFYFRETEFGAEFEHPSFREYLFAEAIIEILKEYGRGQVKSRPERDVYWKDFAKDDSRYDLARKLSEYLAPQWLSPEVAAHLEQLIKWEIGRTSEKENTRGLANPTASLSHDGWTSVRDGLADVWSWWAEGVHLRPQPIEDTGAFKLPEPPYVQQLIKISNALDPEKMRKAQSPNRSVTLDAHLGDGLVRLCALVHYQLALHTGWLVSPPSPVVVEGTSLEQQAQAIESERTPAALWQGVTPIGKGPRQCQSEVRQDNNKWVFFAPSGVDGAYFDNYIHRINAAGWRPQGPFPLGVNLSGIDLRKAVASVPFPYDSSNKALTTWCRANLSEMKANGSYFFMNDFTEVLASKVDLGLSFLLQANFQGADLEGAELNRSACVGANFEGAKLKGSSLISADLTSAGFARADLTNANFSKSECVLANFAEAKLNGAKLNKADLASASFVNADLTKADFSGSQTNELTSFDGTYVQDDGDLEEALPQVGSQTDA